MTIMYPWTPKEADEIIKSVGQMTAARQWLEKHKNAEYGDPPASQKTPPTIGDPATKSTGSKPFELTRPLKIMAWNVIQANAGPGGTVAEPVDLRSGRGLPATDRASGINSAKGRAMKAGSVTLNEIFNGVTSITMYTNVTQEGTYYRFVYKDGRVLSKDHEAPVVRQQWLGLPK
jgi:hypothetical protein